MELITANSAMMPAFGLTAAVALGATVFAVTRGGFLGWSLGIVVGLVALLAVGTLAFSLWGRYFGYPWLFTP